MFTTTIRAMFAQKLRLALTTVSIALGVAFLAGTLILTDTMNTAFNNLFSKVSAGTDAVVREQAPFSTDVGSDRASIAASTLSTVTSVPGVRAAEGLVTGYALMTDPAGKAILAAGGAPTTGSSFISDDKLRGDVNLRNGRAPNGPSEVVIDASSADKHHIALGSQMNILFHGPSQKFTVVGVATFGGEKNLGGSTTAYFDTATAQQVLGTPGQFDQINVSAKSGVSQAELASQLRQVIPSSAEALTGKELAKEFAQQVSDGLGFVTILFSVFAGIALFVGSFIIWNTFTMIVSQRSREIALLRAVGATRRQVMRSLLTESVLMGLGSSAIGLGLGVAVAKGLTALMDMIGFTLPTTSAQVAPSTILISLVVGTLVTVAAAMVPARKATKVLPVEALRDATPGSTAPSKKRAVIGLGVFGVGIAALVSGLFAGAGIKMVGIGVLGIVLGATVLGPLTARPMAAAIGWPLRLRGLPGDLARQNAMRNPRRTSATAAALMIGLALVVSVGVFATSLKASVGHTLGTSTKADLFIARASIGGSGFSTDVVNKVAAVPGVAVVSPGGYGEARFAGSNTGYASIDPATADQVLNLEESAGKAIDLDDNSVMVAKAVAKAHNWTVGSAVAAEFVTTGKHDLRVAAIFDSVGGYIDTDYVMSQAAQRHFDGDNQLDITALVRVAPGADKSAVQKAIATALVDHPDAKVVTQQQFEKDAAGFIDQLLMFVLVMLLLAVIIALLGIVNTLALSVFERTRELGLLRAVGMTRNQVRAMVRWESVVISLIGAITGAALGLGLGVALVRAMKDEGIGVISVPGPQIALYVAAAAVAGVLAAVGPARRAAKVDVLKAVAAS